ncbi:MAG: lipoprotein [Cyanobacteria bacterium REEB65]|nr:lipoprotein [Cyanobacteria bacterium REEB65]
MLKKPLIAAVALAALAGCATSNPTTTKPAAIPNRSISMVRPQVSQADLQAMRALIPARLTPEQAKAKLVKLPADRIQQTGRSVKFWGSYGYYPYSFYGYSYYWPYYSYGGYYYPYSYPYYSFGSYYWPYSYGYWW